MKTWYIWGLYLPVLLIEADSFDRALEEARKINPNYNTGQLWNVWEYTFDYIDQMKERGI